MKRVLRYDPVHSNFAGLVMIDKIAHLSKSVDGEHTLIHLVNQEVLVTNDSLNTLEARLNSDKD